MRVKEVMTTAVVSVSPQSTMAEALDIMARSHVSGLPVLDKSQSLVGIVNVADFLRRPEIGTLGHESPWYESFFLPGRSAQMYARTHGRRIDEIMSSDVATIDENANLDDAISLMEKRHVKRLPVLSSGKMIGILTRGDFMRALAASMGGPSEEQSGRDAAIKRDIAAELHARLWAPIASVEIQVKDGNVVLRGALSDERERKAVRVVAENVNGVLSVQDSMTLIESYLMTPFP